MRFVLPSDKVADRNPDRVGTVHGTFHNENGEVLSFKSKEITKADLANPDTVIDIENGILILPAGERGRKPSASATQSDIDSLLASAREIATA